MILRYLGFCGVDDSVDPDLLQLISLKYEWVEWGVLFRPDLEGSSRYPSWNWVLKLAEVQKRCSMSLKLAAHLCQIRCVDVLEGKSFEFISQLEGIGFRRIQINATKANGVLLNNEQLPRYTSNLRSAILSHPNIEWILQANEETAGLWMSIALDNPPSNISILFDASCGRGIPIHTLPFPIIPFDRSYVTNATNVKFGYAGGIGPKNIRDVLLKLKEVLFSHEKIWVDMESSVRLKILEIETENNGENSTITHDIFSINKCFECIKIVEDLKLFVT